MDAATQVGLWLAGHGTLFVVLIALRVLKSFGAGA